jgi:hypothetical protein
MNTIFELTYFNEFILLVLKFILDILPFEFIYSVVGFIFGILFTISYDLYKSNTLNSKLKKSLISSLLSEQKTNLDLINSFSDHWKLEGLEINDQILKECIKNPNLFSTKEMQLYRNLYNEISYYNLRMPTGLVSEISMMGSAVNYSNHYKELKSLLSDVIN